MGVIEGGVVIEGGIPRSLNPFATVRRATVASTIQSVLNAAVAGDIIAIEPGSYPEALSIVKDNLTLYGLGGRGQVALAPAAAVAAIVVDGTGAGGRVEGVTLINVGGEGNGVGGGLHVKGNIRRIRFHRSKFEGGTFGAKLESTGAGAVGDVHFDDCEFAWTTRGLHITTSGGGDPVTNLWVREGMFHNCSAKWIFSDVAHTTGLLVKKCSFAKEEDASAPAAAQLDVAVANSEGLFDRNSFDLATMAVATLSIAAGIRWVGNATEAGIGGRPS